MISYSKTFLEKNEDNKYKLSSIQDKVTKINKEMGKESDLSVIKVESETKLLNSQKELNNLTTSFKEALEQVKDWENHSDLGNVIEQQKVVPPTVNQRKALFTYYKVFSTLKGDGAQFLKILEEVVNDSGYKKIDSKIPSDKQKVLQALNDIGWNNSEKVGFGQYLKIKPNNQNHDPFSVLLETGYLSTARNEAVKWDKFSTEIKRNGSRGDCWGSYRFRQRCEADAASSAKIFQTVRENVEAKVSAKIALRLINEMKEKLDVKEV